MMKITVYVYHHHVYNHHHDDYNDDSLQTKPNHATLFILYMIIVYVFIFLIIIFSAYQKKMNVNIEFECMHEIYNVPNTESSSSSSNNIQSNEFFFRNQMTLLYSCIINISFDFHIIIIFNPFL